MCHPHNLRYAILPSPVMEMVWLVLAMILAFPSFRKYRTFTKSNREDTIEVEAAEPVIMFSSLIIDSGVKEVGTWMWSNKHFPIFLVIQSLPIYLLCAINDAVAYLQGEERVTWGYVDYLIFFATIIAVVVAVLCVLRYCHDFPCLVVILVKFSSLIAGCSLSCSPGSRSMLWKCATLRERQHLLRQQTAFGFGRYSDRAVSLRHTCV